MGIGIIVIGWEQGIGLGTGNEEIKNLYFFLTTMPKEYDKMHFTLFRRRSKTVLRFKYI